MATMIHIDDYPELKLLCWNYGLPDITEEEAYGRYRGYWRYVREDHLTPKERALINRLVEEQGHGEKLDATPPWRRKRA